MYFLWFSPKILLFSKNLFIIKYPLPICEKKDYTNFWSTKPSFPKKNGQMRPQNNFLQFPQKIRLFTKKLFNPPVIILLFDRLGHCFWIRFLTWSTSDDHTTVSQTGFFHFFFQTHFQPEMSVTIPQSHRPGKKKPGLWEWSLTSWCKMSQKKKQSDKLWYGH